MIPLQKKQTKKTPPSRPFYKQQIIFFHKFVTLICVNFTLIYHKLLRTVKQQRLVQPSSPNVNSALMRNHVSEFTRGVCQMSATSFVTVSVQANVAHMHWLHAHLPATCAYPLDKDGEGRPDWRGMQSQHHCQVVPLLIRKLS